MPLPILVASLRLLALISSHPPMAHMRRSADWQNLPSRQLAIGGAATGFGWRRVSGLAIRDMADCRSALPGEVVEG